RIEFFQLAATCREPACPTPKGIVASLEGVFPNEALLRQDAERTRGNESRRPPRPVGARAATLLRTPMPWRHPARRNRAPPAEARRDRSAVLPVGARSRRLG